MPLGSSVPVLCLLLLLVVGAFSQLRPVDVTGCGIQDEDNVDYKVKNVCYDM